jgi:phosphoribosylglycinamide formyltransferase-1
MRKKMMTKKPRVLVLASGTTTGGGSGFQEMVEYTQTDPPILNAEIVGVASNHSSGGVFTKAKALGIEFTHCPRPVTAEDYQALVEYFTPDLVMCSGWLLPVSGLDLTVINIHPGLLPKFGGKGMWGHHVHEAVMAAYHRGEITQTGVAMHFVTDYKKQQESGVEDPYDKGPVICQFPVKIRPDDTPESLAEHVNEVERFVQSRVLNLIVHREICLHGDHAGYTPKARIILLGMGGVIPNGHSRFATP